jgi:CRP/FNR family transcriptional regulator
MNAGFLLLPEFTAARPPSPPVAARRRLVPTAAPSPTVRVQRLAPREFLFVEGDPSGDVHEVASGAVLVIRAMPDGRRQIVDVVGPGRLFGLTASERHSCSAVAATDTVVCRLERDAATRHAFIADRLARAALVEIDRLRDLALALGHKSAIERVAGFLLSLVGEVDGGPAEIRLPVTRAEMANHLGLTPETFSRNLTRLKKDGLVTDDRGDRILITDRDRLAEIALGRNEPGM